MACSNAHLEVVKFFVFSEANISCTDIKKEEEEDKKSCYLFYKTLMLGRRFSVSSGALL